MTDLAEYRALAATARADTSDGLLAREKLPDVVDALAGELARVRSLRLAHPANAVDPWRHTPPAARAYLAAQGWVRVAARETYEVWQLGEGDRAPCAILPAEPGASDYCKRFGLMLTDLADAGGVGELQALADIEAAA